jgi:hypothetical protein
VEPLAIDEAVVRRIGVVRDEDDEGDDRGCVPDEASPLRQLRAYGAYG